MLKFIILAKASKKKSTRRAAADSAEVFAVILLCIVGLIAAFAFIACPILGICGAAKLINGNVDAVKVAKEWIGLGIFGALCDYLIGGELMCFAAQEWLAPTPWERNAKNASDPCWRKRRIVNWITAFAYLALIGVGVLLALFGFKNMEANNQLAGVLFILLNSIGIISIVLGVIGKLLFD